MDDGIEANVSTFAAEMRETAFILQNATDGCMVIMDELGRGTCTRDGLAIAIAVCEALMKKRVRIKHILVTNGTNVYQISEFLGVCLVCDSFQRACYRLRTPGRLYCSAYAS